MTFLPINANDIAKLVQTNVLPSPGIQLVQSITFSPDSRMKRRLVRKPRNASSIESFVFSRTTSAFSPSTNLPANGMSARMLIFVSFSTSSRPSMR